MNGHLDQRGAPHRQFVVRAFGSPPDSGLEETPRPVVGPHQALVQVNHVNLSYVDALTARGGYQVRPELPFVPGTSGVGTVIEVGSAVDWAKVGERRVLQLPSGGLLSTTVLLDEGRSEPVDSQPDSATLASAIESWTTMRFALTRRTSLQPGQSVLVLGAGGGLGTAAVSVANDQGAFVVAGASTKAKRAAARQAGASAALDTRSDDFPSTVRRLLPHGVDVVVDPAGGTLALAALKLLARYGRFCVLGFASGDIPRLGANRVLIGNHAVVGVDYGDAIRSDRSIQRVLREVVAAFSSGRYRTSRPEVFGFDNVEAALSRAASGLSSRRVVVRVCDRD